MPLRLLVCKHCSHEFEFMVPLRSCLRFRGGVPCERCGSRQTARSFERENQRYARLHAGSRRGDFEPFFSESMAVCRPSERIPGETYDRENRVLVTSAQHRRELMRRLNMYDARDFRAVNRRRTRGLRPGEHP